MKNYTVLFLLFALGCHSSGPNGVSAGAAAVQNVNVNPALVAPDTTLGCQSSIPNDKSQEIKYSDLIDGNAGVYTLQSSTLYSESQPNTQKNANFVLQSNNFAATQGILTTDQSISCSDLSRLDSTAQISTNYEFPYQINRPDGKIISDAAIDIQVAKEGTALVSIPSSSENAPLFPNLKSFISGAKSNHSKRVQIFKVDANEIHILITDKFITPKKNKGIKVILGVYKLSGT